MKQAKFLFLMIVVLAFASCGSDEPKYADHERPVQLVQLHGLFVCLRVGISWFVAAARGECEDYDQEKEK